MFNKKKLIREREQTKVKWEDLKVGEVFMEEYEDQQNYCVKVDDEHCILVDAIGDNIASVGELIPNFFTYDSKYSVPQFVQERYVTS